MACGPGVSGSPAKAHQLESFLVFYCHFLVGFRVFKVTSKAQEYSGVAEDELCQIWCKLLLS